MKLLLTISFFAFITIQNSWAGLAIPRTPEDFCYEALEDNPFFLDRNASMDWRHQQITKTDVSDGSVEVYSRNGGAKIQNGTCSELKSDFAKEVVARIQRIPELVMEESLRGYTDSFMDAPPSEEHIKKMTQLQNDVRKAMKLCMADGVPFAISSAAEAVYRQFDPQLAKMRNVVTENSSTHAAQPRRNQPRR